ncbi:transcriptional modulator of MazE/toxin MazF [Candidatus Scalindua japonica]|uniref:Transcriptional modulator of MazE/toxin MazF n=1 Tax=Candidatus Scalindua japonica TaxID=1284222 RepID=A0A286TZC5_9BACT|nr:type II toxin-antitoxin system PemK/MazF family toxin [Candidatus Scalindua japonica]GAX61242.1 transcriptional modulator of MazE/toxin MazF [Candidatus Scalindua japonica]
MAVIKDFFRWNVYLANLDPTIGSEQGKTRPVVVISEDQINQLLPVVNVLPITSRKVDRKVYPNEALIPNGVGGLTKESIVLCYQIRTLDKKRLIEQLGTIDSVERQDKILDAMFFQLGIFR